MSNAYLEGKLDQLFADIESVRARVRRQEDVTLADEDELSWLEAQRDRLLNQLRPACCRHNVPYHELCSECISSGGWLFTAL
jgi:uncharacterized OB-fold protein